MKAVFDILQLTFYFKCMPVIFSFYGVLTMCRDDLLREKISCVMCV